MNGIGTGDYEYIIMLVVFSFLFLITIGTQLKKWISEKRIAFSSFEFSIVNLLLFLARKLT